MVLEIMLLGRLGLHVTARQQPRPRGAIHFFSPHLLNLLLPKQMELLLLLLLLKVRIVVPVNVVVGHGHRAFAPPNAADAKAEQKDKRKPPFFWRVHMRGCPTPIAKRGVQQRATRSMAWRVSHHRRFVRSDV